MKDPLLLFYLDDDIDDLEIFYDAVAKLNHRVMLFKDAQTMLQELSLGEEKPNIIFLDVHMPIVNGEEILSTLKNSKLWKQIPVVMISGAYPKKLTRQFLGAGANFLMKRPNVNDLTDALDEVIKKSYSNFSATG